MVGDLPRSEEALMARAKELQGMLETLEAFKRIASTDDGVSALTCLKGRLGGILNIYNSISVYTEYTNIYLAAVQSQEKILREIISLFEDKDAQQVIDTELRNVIQSLQDKRTNKNGSTFVAEAARNLREKK